MRTIIKQVAIAALLVLVIGAVTLASDSMLGLVVDQGGNSLLGATGDDLSGSVTAFLGGPNDSFGTYGTALIDSPGTFTHSIDSGSTGSFDMLGYAVLDDGSGGAPDQIVLYTMESDGGGNAGFDATLTDGTGYFSSIAVGT